MAVKSLSPVLLFIIITVTVTVTVSPTSIQSNLDFLQLPSDDIESTYLYPNSVSSSSCPVKCFRPDSVYDIDNVTYWCGCADARCAGDRVAKSGFCDFENGGSGAMSGQALLLVHIVWLTLRGSFVLFALL